MKRFEAVFNETWWLWIGLSVFGLVMSAVHFSFLAVFPISLFAFLYFAYVRYDEDGNLNTLDSDDEEPPRGNSSSRGPESNSTEKADP